LASELTPFVTRWVSISKGSKSQATIGVMKRVAVIGHPFLLYHQCLGLWFGK
jgi:hypothetical protein